MSKQISTKTTIRNLTAEIKKTFVKKDTFTPGSDRGQRGYQVSGSQRQHRELLHLFRQDRHCRLLR